MSAITGVVVGLAAAAGAVALYRVMERRARPLARAIAEWRRPTGERGKVLEFERDPVSGVFRAK
jgi:hypothetical protein